MSSREGAVAATLWVRDGFSIDVFANVPGTLRIIAEAPTGEFAVSELWEGRVLKLADPRRSPLQPGFQTFLVGRSADSGVVP